jgi:uncharacterized peroxidase-related enzyme
MARLKALNPEQATGKTKELFNTITSKFGVVSNMMKTMGNSPAILEGFLNYYGALSSGTLDAKTGELISLAVAENNGCHYCLAAHTFVGKNFMKLDAKTINDARRGHSEDTKTNAILKFTLALVNKKGRVTDEDLATMKTAGVTEGEITEIIAHITFNIFTNYFNITANTEIDFPTE